MKLNIIDGKLKVIEMECNPTDKLSTLIEAYEKKYKSLFPNEKIKSITFFYDGENFSEEDYDKTLNELDLEDMAKITSSFKYDGGLI